MFVLIFTESTERHDLFYFIQNFLKRGRDKLRWISSSRKV